MSRSIYMRIHSILLTARRRSESPVSAPLRKGLLYPPAQKTTPACRNVIAGPVLDRHFVVQARAVSVGLYQLSHSALQAIKKCWICQDYRLLKVNIAEIQFKLNVQGVQDVRRLIFLQLSG